MRYYPTSDADFFWEFLPSWALYCHTPNKSWHRKPLQSQHTINYWRDYEGAKKEYITKEDLYFKQWPYTRIRESACLPLYYCVGNRFIRLERDFPAGFKCKPLPLNLEEAQAVAEYFKQQLKEERLKEKERQRIEKEIAKLEKSGMKKKAKLLLEQYSKQNS